MTTHHIRTTALVAVAAVALAIAIPMAASASGSPQPRVAPHIVGTWPNDVNMGGAGGYEVWNTGKVVALNHAPYYGSAKASPADIVGFAADPDSGGYWLIGANGAVYSEGTTCQDETLVGPKIKPKSGVVGAVNQTKDFTEGFTMVTAAGHLYSYTCEFQFSG
jgi:hypothetical protein